MRFEHDVQDAQWPDWVIVVGDPHLEQNFVDLLKCIMPAMREAMREVMREAMREAMRETNHVTDWMRIIVISRGDGR